jgi:hypothetical protein
MSATRRSPPPRATRAFNRAALSPTSGALATSKTTKRYGSAPGSAGAAAPGETSTDHSVHKALNLARRGADALTAVQLVHSVGAVGGLDALGRMDVARTVATWVTTLVLL